MMGRMAWNSEDAFVKYFWGCGLYLAAALGPVLMIQRSIDQDRPETIVGCAIGTAAIFFWLRSKNFSPNKRL